MGAMVSQIPKPRDYWTVHSGTDQTKHQSSTLLALCVGNSPVTGEFPAQRASNTKNVPIWWRHHEKYIILGLRRWLMPWVLENATSHLADHSELIAYADYEATH